MEAVQAAQDEARKQREQIQKVQKEYEERNRKQNTRAPKSHGGPIFTGHVEDVATPAPKVQRLQGAELFVNMDNFTFEGIGYRKGDAGSFDSDTTKRMLEADPPLPIKEVNGLDEAYMYSSTIAKPGIAQTGGPPAMAGVALEPNRPEDSEEPPLPTEEEEERERQERADRGKDQQRQEQERQQQQERDRQQQLERQKREQMPELPAEEEEEKSSSKRGRK